jgi:DNA recombination protein RmuC
MIPLLPAVFILLALVLALVLLLFRRLSVLSHKESDWAPILNNLAAIRQGLEQVDRSVRDEISRNRQEQSTQSQVLRSEVVTALTRMGDSVSNKVEGLTLSNDQKLELLRSGMEQRLDSFTTESSRKIDGLTQQTDQKLSDVESALRNEAQQLREETGAAFKSFGDTILVTLTGISQLLKSELQDLKATVDGRLATIQTENEKKLEQMRQTVDEKLQSTLDARLGESFKQVSDRLEQVYKGLGEMQTLAAGVGDLKRVLTNVKTRGTWGEVQLGTLLEQMLAPDQYAQNVATSGTGERVEYAIRLPGPNSNGTPVWLPIDAKFRKRLEKPNTV